MNETGDARGTSSGRHPNPQREWSASWATEILPKNRQHLILMLGPGVVWKRDVYRVTKKDPSRGVFCANVFVGLFLGFIHRLCFKKHMPRFFLSVIPADFVKGSVQEHHFLPCSAAMAVLMIASGVTLTD